MATRFGVAKNEIPLLERAKAHTKLSWLKIEIGSPGLTMGPQAHVWPPPTLASEVSRRTVTWELIMSWLTYIAAIAIARPIPHCTLSRSILLTRK